MTVTWHPRTGVELIGADDLARASVWLDEQDWSADAPLSRQLDALAEAATWCRSVRRTDEFDELDDFVAFEETRLCGRPDDAPAGREPRSAAGDGDIEVAARTVGRSNGVRDGDPAGLLPQSDVEGSSPSPSLFQFQQHGIEYLATRRRAILADEQGLGKTAQALVAWWRHRSRDEALVVVTPLSVLHAWASAVRTWLGVDPVHGGAAGGELPLQVGGVTLTTWERLPGRPPSRHPDICLVVDEAHRAKNRNARRTKAVRAWAQDSRTVWGLTGTPILSAAADLPGIAFALDLPAHKPAPGRGMKAEKAARVFAGRIREHMLRRTRQQVEIELPAKVYDEHPVELAMAHAADIDQCQFDVEQQLGRPVDQSLIELMFGLAEHEGDDDPPRWSDAMGVLASLRSLLAVAKAQQVTDADFMNINADCGPLVVVSAHRAPVQALGDRDGWSSIIGGLSGTERQRRIDAFQAGDLDGLALTIGAGGVGITLTRARCMVVIDRAWTAAENDQVEDRICRIGQAADTVRIVDVVADHPVDRLVADCIARKRRLIRRDVDAGAVPDWREAHRARIARWRRALEAL